MHHHLVVGLKELADSKIFWISGKTLYAHYAGDNPTGWSGKIGKITHIKDQDVFIKGYKHDVEYIKTALEVVVPF